VASRQTRMGSAKRARGPGKWTGLSVSYRVEGLHFTGAVKEELAYPVRAAFEDRTVRVPRSAEIRADLRSVRKESTASGNVRFAGERTRNGHADRFWALALALHASKEADGGQYWAQVVR